MKIKASRFRKAFTLIEILVVAAIVGVMVGVAIPQWTRATTIRRLEKRNANLRTLNITADRLSLGGDGHYVDNGTGTFRFVPNWPTAFVDPSMSTDAEKNTRASNVVSYFFDEGYLPGNLRGVIDLDGIGYHPSGYFIEVDMN